MDKENPHSVESQAILQAAKDALGEVSPQGQEIVVINTDYGTVDSYSPPPPPDNSQPSFNQKFGDLPTQLRELPEVNLYEVKRLNLAAMIEAMERANQSYEAFPTPDAGFAVASLSEQIQKLTKDLEKSQDPKRLYDAVLMDVIQPFAEQIVHAVAMEMKWLKNETKGMVVTEKQTAHQETINQAVQRIGPSLKDAMEISKVRLLKSLGIKEKPPHE